MNRMVGRIDEVEGIDGKDRGNGENRWEVGEWRE